MQKLIDSFITFRQKVYNRFKSLADSTMDLLDAISGNTTAQSVPELSLETSYRRQYSSIYKSIESLTPKKEVAPESPPCPPEPSNPPGDLPDSEEVAPESPPCPPEPSNPPGDLPESKGTPPVVVPQGSPEQPPPPVAPEPVPTWLELTADLVPSPSQYPFHLFGLDTTPFPRPHACTLEDRGFVHSPNAISSNKPITIGHQYSILNALPEKEHTQGVPWTVPLSQQRVTTQDSGIEVGKQQIEQLFSPGLPWDGELIVVVSDSYYSVASFLYPQAERANCVVITRVRSNRVFYCLPEVPEGPRSVGHPPWYGERFELKNPASWHPPDEVVETDFETPRGRKYEVTIQVWPNLLMRGTKAAPMHKHPFTLLRIEMRNPLTGVTFKPMWLIVVGQRRQEVKPKMAWEAYRQRYNLEHFFRFGKQRLLMTAFQTPEVQHEENWIQLVLLAYVQLWATRGLAKELPRPWERYQSQTDANQPTKVTPSMVQRDFARIIAQIGTPAQPPKPRGYSPGRAKGETQTPRPRCPVVKKAKKETSTKKKTA